MINLKQKRKREKSDVDSEEEILSKSNKKKKLEITNYLEFPNKTTNDLNDSFSKIDDPFLKNKLYITSKKIKYNYLCQKLTVDSNPNSNLNSIIIKDAKILILEKKVIFFLLSSNKLYIYENEQNINFQFIKEIPLDQQNSFTFTFPPTKIFLTTPEKKGSRKNHNNNNININNNNPSKKIKTKMILYLCIVSCKERYLCEFDLKKQIFKKVKNIIPKKNMPQYLISNDMRFKLFKKNRILSYNNNCAYVQKLFGTPKFKNLKQKNIESITILNDNLFSVCTSDIVYIFDSENDNILGEIKTFTSDKKAKLLKPDNNLLMVYSSSDVAFYDLESLMFLQKLNLEDIFNDYAQPIKKVKQLNNNNIAILFNSIFVIYNLEKDSITFKLDYFDKKNYINSILMEINPNVVLLNNDEKNFYLVNSIKGDKIANLNINNINFNLCKKIQKYKFKYGAAKEENIEGDENDKDNNYILMNNNVNTFILSSHKEK